MKVWLQNEKGEQYKLELFSESEQNINDVLDQINLAHFKHIAESDFNVPDAMVIDVMDRAETTKIGELTCKNIL